MNCLFTIRPPTGELPATNFSRPGTFPCIPSTFALLLCCTIFYVIFLCYFLLFWGTNVLQVTLFKLGDYIPIALTLSPLLSRIFMLMIFNEDIELFKLGDVIPW